MCGLIQIVIDGGKDMTHLHMAPLSCVNLASQQGKWRCSRVILYADSGKTFCLLMKCARGQYAPAWKSQVVGCEAYLSFVGGIC
jgi:hypothetical protein